MLQKAGLKNFYIAGMENNKKNSSKGRNKVCRMVYEVVRRTSNGSYEVELVDKITRPATEIEANSCMAAGGIKELYQKRWSWTGTEHREY